MPLGTRRNLRALIWVSLQREGRLPMVRQDSRVNKKGKR